MLLALERSGGVRLVEPAIGQRVVLAAHAEPIIDHPLDAHDVEADTIELLERELQPGDVGELLLELLQPRQRRAVEQLRREPAHANRIADGVDVLARAHCALLVRRSCWAPR